MLSQKNNPNIKRRNLLLGIAAGIVVVAFDPFSKQWLAQTPAQPETAVDIPNLDGTLLLASNDLAEFADDFGHIASETPVAVLQPASKQDIVKAVQFANQFDIAIAMRGQGHAPFGQAQVEAGIVIDSRTLNAIHSIGTDRAVVDPGVTILQLLEAATKQGLTPPVLPDYLELSIGALSQTGGIGGHTQRFGLVADTVLEIEAITGQGALISASLERSPEVFNSIVGGLGQFCIVTQVTIALIPAPTTARVYRLSYNNLEAYIAAQARSLAEARFSFLEGQAVPDPSGEGWDYLLEAASYYEPNQPPDDDTLLKDLNPDAGTEILEFSYFDWQNRLAPVVADLRASGVWEFPHPWINLFLPASQTTSYIRSVLQNLAASDVNGPVLLYPFLRNKLTRPFIKVPAEEVIYLFSLLRTAEPDPEVVESMLVANRSLFEQARDRGAKSYQVNALPFSQPDWIAHFGNDWDKFIQVKDSLDPERLLAPGQGIFTSGAEGT